MKIKNHLKLVLVSVIIFVLAACASKTGYSGLVTRNPPTLAGVAVFKPDCDGIYTQTIAATCPFIGTNDPPNIVCQNPSNSSPPVKMIEWTSTDGEFTLEFPNGNPFVNTNGTCSISTKGTVFTCVIRNDNPANPLEPVYKYNVVFGENCRLDPVVMLTR